MISESKRVTNNLGQLTYREGLEDFVQSQSQKASYPKPTDADRELMNRVFSRLKANISGWKQAIGTPDVERMAKQEWFKAFVDHGINREEQLHAGFAYLRANPVDWWPSVAKFIGWCKENGGFDFPTARVAYYEYCRNLGNLEQAKWSHPIIRIAGREAGNYELKTLPESKSFPLFERAYAVLLKRIRAGEDVDYSVPRALPATIERPLDRQENKKRMAALLGAL